MNNKDERDRVIKLIGELEKQYGHMAHVTTVLTILRNQIGGK